MADVGTVERSGVLDETERECLLALKNLRPNLDRVKFGNDHWVVNGQMECFSDGNVCLKLYRVEDAHQVSFYIYSPESLNTQSILPADLASWLKAFLNGYQYVGEKER